MSDPNWHKVVNGLILDDENQGCVLDVSALRKSEYYHLAYSQFLAGASDRVVKQLLWRALKESRRTKEK